MHTKRALSILSKGKINNNGVVGPLYAKKDEFLAQWESRQAAILARQNSEIVNTPVMNVLKKKIAEVAGTPDKDTPIAMKFYASQAMKSAALCHPKDRGLMMVARHMEKLWQEDPMGSFTLGEVSALRSHYHDSYPNSKVAKVLEKEIKKVGYSNLPIAKLVRIASKIEDQADFDNAVLLAGYAGNRPEQISARTLIRNLVDRRLANVEEEACDMSASKDEDDDRTASEKAIDRVAQSMDDDAILEEELIEDAPAEEEFSLDGNPLPAEDEPMMDDMPPVEEPMMDEMPPVSEGGVDSIIEPIEKAKEVVREDLQSLPPEQGEQFEEYKDYLHRHDLTAPDEDIVEYAGEQEEEHGVVPPDPDFIEQETEEVLNDAGHGGGSEMTMSEDDLLPPVDEFDMVDDEPMVDEEDDLFPEEMSVAAAMERIAAPSDRPIPGGELYKSKPFRVDTANPVAVPRVPGKMYGDEYGPVENDRGNMEVDTPSGIKTDTNVDPWKDRPIKRAPSQFEVDDKALEEAYPSKPPPGKTKMDNFLSGTPLPSKQGPAEYTFKSVEDAEAAIKDTRQALEDLSNNKNTMKAPDFRQQYALKIKLIQEAERFINKMKYKRNASGMDAPKPPADGQYGRRNNDAPDRSMDGGAEINKDESSGEHEVSAVIEVIAGLVERAILDNGNAIMIGANAIFVNDNDEIELHTRSGGRACDISNMEMAIRDFVKEATTPPKPVNNGTYTRAILVPVPCARCAKVMHFEASRNPKDLYECNCGYRTKTTTIHALLKTGNLKKFAAYRASVSPAIEAELRAADGVVVKRIGQHGNSPGAGGLVMVDITCTNPAKFRQFQDLLRRLGVDVQNDNMKLPPAPESMPMTGAKKKAQMGVLPPGGMDAPAPQDQGPGSIAKGSPQVPAAQSDTVMPTAQDAPGVSAEGAITQDTIGAAVTYFKATGIATPGEAFSELMKKFKEKLTPELQTYALQLLLQEYTAPAAPGGMAAAANKKAFTVPKVLSKHPAKQKTPTELGKNSDDEPAFKSPKVVVKHPAKQKSPTDLGRDQEGNASPAGFKAPKPAPDGKVPGAGDAAGTKAVPGKSNLGKDSDASSKGFKVPKVRQQGK